MTKKRHPAAASRVLTGGLSTAAVLALTTGFALGAPPDTAAPVPPPKRAHQPQRQTKSLRVVVTDDRIDVADAVTAARRALRAGVDVAYVEVEPLAPLIQYVTVAASGSQVAAASAAPASAVPAAAAPGPPPPLPPPAPSASHTTTSSS